MPNNDTLLLPQLIIFGLENAICAHILMKDRYEIMRNEYGYHFSNCNESEFHYYADARPIFETLKQNRVGIAFVFDLTPLSTKKFFYPDSLVANTFLQISQLDKYVPDKAKWWAYLTESESDKFKDKEDQEPGRCEQITMIHKRTGIPYTEMLFFEADNKAVQNIEKLMGLVVHAVPQTRRREQNLITVIVSGIKEYTKVQKTYFQPTVDTRSCWKKLDTKIPKNTRMPQLMIFILESIIDADLLLRDQYPFIANIRNKRVSDSMGNELHDSFETHEIFQTLNQKGVGITFIFNCKVYVGEDFLEKSQLDKYTPDEAKWWRDPHAVYAKFPSHCESCEYNFRNTREHEKLQHIISIHEKTGIPYREMLFFDVNNNTVRDLVGRTGMEGYVIPKQTGGKLDLITVIAGGIRKYSEIRNKQFQISSSLLHPQELTGKKQKAK